tara:strand:+ start:8238 stop:8405 length:168 start_codon:yes stop_codon:yes gene_type:complete
MENNEITHDLPTITMEQMSFIQWGLNNLMTPPTKGQLTPEDVQKVEELLELLEDC